MKKTKITIMFETNSAREIFEDIDGKEVDVSKEIENEMHNILKELMNKESLFDDLVTEILRDPKTSIEGVEKLSDFCDYRFDVTIENDGKAN